MNKINVTYRDFTNKVYLQTTFNRKSRKYKTAECVTPKHPKTEIIVKIKTEISEFQKANIPEFSDFSEFLIILSKNILYLF